MALERRGGWGPPVASSRDFDTPPPHPQPDRPPEHPVRLVVVCTANVSRSPLAAALLGRQLGAMACVTSAGINAPLHLDVDHRSVHYGLERGVVLGDHRPRQLTGRILAHDGEHLILTMTRQHLREIRAIDVGAVSRAFTLKEFTRRGEQVSGDFETVTDLVGLLSRARRPEELEGDDSADDIKDPYGRSEGTFRRIATEIVDHCDRAAGLVSCVGSRR